MKLMIRILFVIVCLDIFVYGNANKYQYVKTKVCTIPILNSLLQKDNNITSNSYMFVSKKKDYFDDFRLDPQVDIMQVTNTEIKKFKKNLLKFSYKKTIKFIDGVEVWYLDERLLNGILTVVFYENLVILTVNYDRKEIIPLIQYCNSHKFPHY